MKPSTLTASPRLPASIPAASHRDTAPALPSRRRCRRCCLLPPTTDCGGADVATQAAAGSSASRSSVASDDRSIFRRCPNAAAASARSTVASGPTGDSCSSLGGSGTTLTSDLHYIRATLVLHGTRDHQRHIVVLQHSPTNVWVGPCLNKHREAACLVAARGSGAAAAAAGHDCMDARDHGS